MKQSRYTIGLFVAALVLTGASCGTTLDGGVYRSIDYAETWESRNYIGEDGRKTLTIGNVSVADMAFHPEDSNVIFLGTKGNGLYVSVDAGEHWSQGQIPSGNVYAVTFDPVEPEIAYAGKDTSILKTLDSGQTWETVYTDPKGAKINDIVIDSFDHRIVYAATSVGGIYKSYDFGENWDLRLQYEEPVNELLIPSYNTRIIYALLGDGKLYVTHNSAEPDDPEVADLINTGWDNLLTEEVQTEFEGFGEIKDIAMDPNEQSVIYAVTRRGIMRGELEGTAWSDVPTLFGFDDDQNNSIRNLTITPGDSNILYYNVGNTLYKSTDAGITWTTLTSFPSSRRITLLRIDPEVNNVVYAGTEEVEQQKGLIKKSSDQ